MLDLVRRCVATHLGPGAAGRKWEARVVSLDTTRGDVDGYCFLVLGENGAPRWVARAARTAAGKAIFRTDHENLVLLESRGMNAGAPRVPSPVGIWEERETLVTLQTALEGTPLKNVPGPRLFGDRVLEATLGQVMAWWYRFHECFGLYETAITPEIYDTEVAVPARRFVVRFQLTRDEEAFLDRRLSQERRLEGRTLPFMARHGDFCTANMVLTSQGLGVFDWEFPLAPRLPLFDLFFLLSSTRQPFDGVRGESTHFESFIATFWGASRYAAAARGTLREACERQGVATDLLEDLFLVALLHVANMKYEALLEARSIVEDPLTVALARDDEDKRRRWAALPAADKDVPFARIRDGRLENLCHLVREGFPRF